MKILNRNDLLILLSLDQIHNAYTPNMINYLFEKYGDEYFVEAGELKLSSVNEEMSRIRNVMKEVEE